MRDHGPQSRARGGAAARAAATLVSQHWSWQRSDRREAARCERHGDALDRIRARAARRLLAPLRRRARAAVLRERNQRPRGCSATDDARVRSKTPFTSIVVNGDARRRSIRRSRAPRPRRTITLTIPAGGAADGAAAALRQATREQPFADFDAVFAARSREADEFYASLQARHRPTPTRGSCSGRRSPA